METQLELCGFEGEKRSNISRQGFDSFDKPSFDPQADVKIPGLPLKVVMEAIQQATGKLPMAKVN